jgi:hypothetical protein
MFKLNVKWVKNSLGVHPTIERAMKGAEDGTSKSSI